jgi:capsular exopolysaccharide synthesis family protein
LEYNQHIKTSSSNDSIDFNKLGIILKNNWVWIALIFIVVNSAAYLFVRYTKNLYESYSELKLDIKTNASELGIKNIVEDQNANMVSGEIEMIRSKLFLNRVIDYSDLEVSFFNVGRVLNEELFNKAPAMITYRNKNHSFYNHPISFEEINDAEFLLQPADGKEITGVYGQITKIGDLELVMKRNADFRKGDEIGYFFVINSRDALLDYLSRNLTAEPLNFNANTIRISFKDYSPYKAQAVLNKIDTLYLQYSNEQKNLANKQKIDWLTNELRLIEAKMEQQEDYFENFTLQNKTSDLDEDLRQTIMGINALDSQRLNLIRRTNDLDLLIDQLHQGEFLFPFSIRQHLPVFINEQLDVLQQIQLEQDKLKLSYQEITFAYRQKQREIESVKAKTLSQLTDLKNEWRKKLQETTQKKQTLENEFASLPDKNTEYSKNQRFYNLYEQFYLLLMQSKSEFEIAQAGSTPDFKILSPASLSTIPISPHKIMIAGIGLVASMVLIFFFVGILYLANNKINNLYELEKISAAPVLGTVPLSKHLNGALHITEYPKSIVSEAIRTLRTNLDFFNLSSNKKVIAVSSTVSGEGKSFIAMNLSGVFALSKKKVILIDLDMRKAKSSLPVKDSDLTRGVSTVLIKRDRWEDCVVKTSLENFDYLPSGPHPPNPSELLLNGEFTDMLKELKDHYDCIIMDTPPVGLVTDGIMAMKQADISVYVFRANYSKKDFITNLQRIVAVNKFSNITTILNAVPSLGKTYGYGYYDERGNSTGKIKSIFKT